MKYTIETFNNDMEIVEEIEEYKVDNLCQKPPLKCIRYRVKKELNCEQKLANIENILRRNKLKIMSDKVALIKIKNTIKKGK
jgi:hypothetical protein